MLEWDDGPLIKNPRVYFDSRQPRGYCFVSHAHSDHLGRHQHTLCTPATAALAASRVELAQLTTPEFGQVLQLDEHTRVSLHPAGHVLGSAMILLERPEGSLLYTGDYKLRPSLTVERPDPPKADILVMESTFGIPRYRFPPRQQVIDQLLAAIDQAFDQGRQPIVFGYSLGKSQEEMRILTDAGHTVTCHGAVYTIAKIYQQLGVNLGRPEQIRRYDAADFHGQRQLDLRHRGVLIAPPNASRSAFTTRFNNPFTVVLTGWALDSGAMYRYGVNLALPFSDHADFDELLQTIEIVGPKKVLSLHGFKQFPDELRKRGIDASLARPDAQLSLFE